MVNLDYTKSSYYNEQMPYLGLYYKSYELRSLKCLLIADEADNFLQLVTNTIS